jgi:hypothetical protein
LIVLLLLAVSVFQPAIGGMASGRPTDTLVVTWDSLGRAAERSVLQMDNNTTAPPSFAELLPIIIFVLAGVGIAIVVVAAGLWIARRARKGKEGEGQARPAVGKDGEDDEWGAKWESDSKDP